MRQPFDRKYSRFFELTGAQGYGEEPAKKAVPYAVCPICGLNRPVIRTHSYAIMRAKRYLRTVGKIKRWAKEFEEGRRIRSRAKTYNPSKELRFDVVNIVNEPFILFKVPLGRGGEEGDKGFKEVPELHIRFKDLKKLPEYERELYGSYAEQIKSKCKEILNYFRRLGL